MGNSIRLSALALALCGFVSVPLVAQVKTTIRAGTLIDGRGKTWKNVLITVVDSKILGIAPFVAGTPVTYDFPKYT